MFKTNSFVMAGLALAAASLVMVGAAAPMATADEAHLVAAQAQAACRDTVIHGLDPKRSFIACYQKAMVEKLAAAKAATMVARGPR